MSDNPDDETETKKKSQGGFFVTLLKKVIWMVIFLFVGIAMLYGCKVAAAHLIPTTLGTCDVNFDSIEKKGKTIISERLSCVQPEEIPDTTTVNITIANNKQGVPYSKRLTFSYKEIYEKYMNTGVLKYLKLWQNGNNASRGKAFLSRMIEGAIFANFSIFSKVYETLNSAASTPLAETLVIFILPMIFMYVYPLFIIVNMFLFVGFFFFNLSVFTKKREPFQPQDPPQETKWVNYEPDEDGEWSTFGKFLLYLGGFFMMGIPLMLGSFLGMFMPIYSIIYPLFATGTVGGKPYNFGNFFTDMLKFKKHMIMYYFSFNVIVGAYNSGENGPATALTALLAILFIWVFDKMFGVFTPYDWEKNDSKVMTVMTGDIPSPVSPSKPSGTGSGVRPVPTSQQVEPTASGLEEGAEAGADQTNQQVGEVQLENAPIDPSSIANQPTAGAQIQVPGAQPPIPGAGQPPVPGAQPPVPGAQPPIPGAGQPIPGAGQPPVPEEAQPQLAAQPPPVATARATEGGDQKLSGGEKRNEGMVGFAKRIFDTLLLKPIMDNPEKKGGKASKNMKTRKIQ